LRLLGAGDRTTAGVAEVDGTAWMGMEAAGFCPDAMNES
jgi:hypothetical protein